MIKRPLHHQFRDAVLEGRKFTTMREKPWPVGVPIMLYHWAGSPYRSKHVDIAVVEVVATDRVVLRRDLDGEINYRRGGIFELPGPLWYCEGFESQEDMDEWFAPLLGVNPLITRHLMLFRVIQPGGAWAANFFPH